MSESGVQITIQATDEFSNAFNSAQESLNQFSSSVSEFSSTESSFTSSANQAVESTNELTQAQEQAAQTTNQLKNDTQSAGETFSSGMQSLAGMTGAMSMAATTSIALGDSYMQQQDASLKLQNSQQNLSKQEQIVQQDQEKLAYAQQKLTDLQNSGHASATALAAAQQTVTTASDTLQNAQISLANAQNNVTSAQNRMTMVNEQVTMQWLNMATMVLPNLLAKGPEILTFLGLMQGEEDALTISQLGQAAASGVASAAMTVFDAVMDANPIVLVVLAVGGLVAALAYLTDGFKNFKPLENDFNLAWKDLQIVLNDVVSFIKSDVYPVLDELYKIYIQPIITGINDISGIGNKISGGISSLGKDLHITGLATGGIVDQPTLAVIGEEGPEAVVPLPSATLTTPSGYQALPSITAQTSSSSNSIRTATINIQQNNNIASNVDVNAMTDEMATKIAQRLELGY